MVITLAPGLVHAEGQESQQPQQQQPPPPAEPKEPAEEPDGRVPPKPAGVGSAAQPADDADETPDDQGDQTVPPASPDGTTGPKPAGVGTVWPPASDEDTRDEQSQEPLPAGGGMGGTSGRFAGLFGGAAPSRSEPQTLTLTGSVFAVRVEGETDGEVPLERDLLGDGQSTYGGAGASLAYARTWTNATIGASGGTNVAYVTSYEDRGLDPWVNRWSVAANGAFSKQMTRRLGIGAGALVDYSPYYEQDLLSQALVPTVAPIGNNVPGLDFILERDPSIHMTATTTANYSLGQKSSIEGYYDYFRRDFVSSDTRGYANQSIGGRYRYRFGRWLGLRAGYGFRTADYGTVDAEPYRNHEFDIGADTGYGRSFTLARRTTFSFSTGSTLVAARTLTEGAPETNAGRRTNFVLTGSTDLVHAWGRSWSANVGASRSLRYELGFNDPFLANAAYAGVGGLLSERLDVNATATYTTGSVGFQGGDNGFGTAAVSAGVRWAIFRQLATYAQYFYYHYDFGSDVTLPGYLRRGLDRQGVSVGLTTWIPLIGSRGRP
jgi:hypothetical protein